MSADPRDGSPAAQAKGRTGPRHAAPKKPLFTRFQVPAGKAIAMAAMPTAVLMGMGFTPTLALADEQPSASNSLKADEYKDCLAALEDDKDGASPSPSASESEAPGDEDKGSAEPTPSASAGSDANAGKGGSSSSSDSGSDDKGDKTEPAPTPSASESASGEDDEAAPSPSPSESGGNILDDIGDAIGGILTGGKSTESPSPTPSASASPSGDTSTAEGTETSSDTSKDDASDAVKKTTDTVEDTVKDTTDKASKAAGDTTEAAEKAAEKAAEDAAGKATASPSPSASPSVDPEDCPAATDAEGGVDNELLVPDEPWRLEASSLTLKGADYQGIVEVKTASGATKKVLKYVINDGTDIGDLHQLVTDKQSGKTHHVQAAKGSKSTITDGKTVMYTEKISGNLLGLIPVTFDPEHPPPLNIPLIYFTNVKVVQAGQFGGTLTVPGLHQYVTD
ncbi:MULTISPECIES: hypothetical protein [Streptomyces]|uniref:hypothetical protein n=1 Tax=Streptomyces TaxID=1883 RepID=UPI00068BF5FD|nr:hypothetical protein [Streptomyces sp. NRRL S-475]